MQNSDAIRFNRSRISATQRVERWLSQNGSGADVVAIREFLRMVRQDAQPQPLEIRVINAEQIGATPKVLTVNRSDDGKLTGAISQPIN